MSTALVGFAGMTHLGIVSAVATAARGFTIRAYDPDESVAQRLRCRGLPIVEPDLDELVAANQDRLTFTATPSDLASCNVVYIAADAPTDDQGESDLTLTKGLIGQAADNLQDDAILVLLCQLPPGFTRALTGLPNDRLFCQVETLIFGRAVERALHPEPFIVGCADPPRPLPACYREVLEAFGCPVLPMRYESAELAKITINFCLVASITVANVLAEISESIGADWAEIVPALVSIAASAPTATSPLGSALRAGIWSATYVPCSISHTGTGRMRASWMRGSQTPTSARLVLARAAGSGVENQPEGSHRGARVGLQGKYPLDQKLARTGASGAIAGHGAAGP